MVKFVNKKIGKSTLFNQELENEKCLGLCYSENIFPTYNRCINFNPDDYSVGEVCSELTRLFVRKDFQKKYNSISFYSNLTQKELTPIIKWANSNNKKFENITIYMRDF